MTCKECNGTGLYVGLNETSECRACSKDDVQISMEVWVDGDLCRAGESWTEKAKGILEGSVKDALLDLGDCACDLQVAEAIRRALGEQVAEWETLGYLEILR